MSILCLPDELILYISSYLHYNSLSLSLTCKRINNLIPRKNYCIDFNTLELDLIRDYDKEYLNLLLNNITVNINININSIMNVSKSVDTGIDCLASNVKHAKISYISNILYFRNIVTLDMSKFIITGYSYIGDDCIKLQKLKEECSKEETVLDSAKVSMIELLNNLTTIKVARVLNAKLTNVDTIYDISSSSDKLSELQDTSIRNLYVNHRIFLSSTFSPCTIKFINKLNCQYHNAIISKCFSVHLINAMYIYATDVNILKLEYDYPMIDATISGYSVNNLIIKLYNITNQSDMFINHAISRDLKSFNLYIDDIPVELNKCKTEFTSHLGGNFIAYKSLDNQSNFMNSQISFKIYINEYLTIHSNLDVL